MDLLNNRFAILVIPKQPFIDWINCVSPRNPPYTVDEMSPEIYLLESREEDDEDRLVRIIEGHHRMIFEAELEAWCTRQTEWPRDRGLETFNAWLDVAFCPLVFDLAASPIRKDPA